MFEKVNPSHPDKVADRIAGALVDLAYAKSERPIIAIEVLIGHGQCHIISETSVHFTSSEVKQIVQRMIDEKVTIDYIEVPQDPELSRNQETEIKCGDNGIFKGETPAPCEQFLSQLVRKLYQKFPTDGKFIYDEKSNRLIACQSNGSHEAIASEITKIAQDLKVSTPELTINPLGDWTGGINVDTGATNRKLGSDMGRAVTGGGLHGKDLSKADVSINIACCLLAAEYHARVEAFVAIGDDTVKFKIYQPDKTKTLSKTYAAVVQMAEQYIQKIGGFEELAKWGLL